MEGKTMELRIEELEKKVAELEVQVQAQPKDKNVFEEQLDILICAQEKCATNKNYNSFVDITQLIIDLIVRSQNQFNHRLVGK